MDDDKFKDFLTMLANMNDLREKRDQSIRDIYKDLATRAYDIKMAFIDAGFSEDEAFEFAYGLVVEVVGDIRKK